MCLSPLSPPANASFPQILRSPGLPAMPKPILESQLRQSFSLLPRMPIRTFAGGRLAYVQAALNPSLLQLGCKDAC